MAFDRQPFGVVEVATEVLVAAAQVQAFTPGAALSNPKHGALGVVLVVSNPSAGGFGAAFDAIMQTATDDATVDGDWIDTDTRINGIAAAGTYSVEGTDPVMDRVRLRLAGIGFLGVSVRTQWLSDKQPVLI